MTPRAWKRLFARILVWAGIILGSILLLLFIRSTWHVFTKEREAAQAHADESQALAEMQARQKSLTEQIHNLDTARGVEEEVRDRYPVAKSGEEVIVLTDNPNAKGGTTTPALSPWQAFLGWFSWF